MSSKGHTEQGKQTFPTSFKHFGAVSDSDRFRSALLARYRVRPVLQHLNRLMIADLVRESNGNITISGAEKMKLGQVVEKLDKPRQTNTSDGVEGPEQQQIHGTSNDRSTTSTGAAEYSPKSACDKVFISYSHKDTKFLEELLVHLKPLERASLVTKWSDKQIALAHNGSPRFKRPWQILKWR